MLGVNVAIFFLPAHYLSKNVFLDVPSEQLSQEEDVDIVRRAFECGDLGKMHSFKTATGRPERGSDSLLFDMKSKKSHPKVAQTLCYYAYIISPLLYTSYTHIIVYNASVSTARPAMEGSPSSAVSIPLVPYQSRIPPVKGVTHGAILA